jgi:hypothetical protein
MPIGAHKIPALVIVSGSDASGSEQEHEAKAAQVLGAHVVSPQ